MNYKGLAVVGAAILCFSFSHASVEAAPEVPENIFRWVQSSARTNYYFNRQQICFGVHEDGTIDTDTLIVPVLKTFDDVMINEDIAHDIIKGISLCSERIKDELLDELGDDIQVS